ncbi:hypothetical protein FQN57_000868 [Myotisia sp. PD_48]|nr:hypothetical protein FQN57_000868 [Myotisia sp. PD_48]
MNRCSFKVVIVGGSIAGLTLAHGLEKLGIDYVVLEKRSDIAPQEGASIGIMPNGGRILEQLGIFNAVEASIEPLDSAHVAWPDGYSFSTRAPDILNERFGFPLAFLERQRFLQILYASLPGKSKVFLNKSMIRLEPYNDGQVRVHTQDGSFYDGHLVVGADGVHSQTRSEMWRIAESLQPGLITQSEKNAMTVEYACTFGISASVNGMSIGEQVTMIDDGICLLTFPGKLDRVYWFMMEKLDQKYSYGSAPRYSLENTVNRCDQLADRKAWKNDRFEEVWRKRVAFSKTALEENLFVRWHFGRIVCIGDSMHKLAPNTGQGANCAIEDAASLLNLLNDYLASDTKPSDPALDARLQRFAEVRVRRMHKICQGARLVVRIHARDGLLMKLFGRYYMPYAKNLAVNRASEAIAGAEFLNFLPLPIRSGPGWISYRSHPRSINLQFGAILSILVAMLLYFSAPYLSSRQSKVYITNKTF